MSIKSPPTDLPILSFSTASEFESFLEREHAISPGIYLKLAKKSCKQPSVTSAAALEVALCYGWINGRGDSFDDDRYLARYTPRRPKSTWSKINVDLVKRLSDEGRMRPAGIAAVDAAKADGRWNRAYASPSTIAIPDDFSVALGNEPRAAAFFESLKKTERYYCLLQMELASPRGRGDRMQSTIQMLADGLKPGVSQKAKMPKSKTSKPQGIKKRTTAKGRPAIQMKSDLQPEDMKGASPNESRRSRLRTRS